MDTCYRDYIRRATMTLLLAVMTATTAWAQTTIVGEVEVYKGGPRCAYVKGWAYDTSQPGKSLDIRVLLYKDEGCTQELSTPISSEFDNPSANVARNDVPALQNVEGNHGFETYFDAQAYGFSYVKIDECWVKVYAIDPDLDEDDQIGQQDRQIGETTKVVLKNLMVGGFYVERSTMRDIFLDTFYGYDYVQASFDNETNTLTLDDHGDLKPDEDGVIIYSDFDLTIKGRWHMDPHIFRDCNKINTVIYCCGNLTLDGDFLLLSFPEYSSAKTILVQGDLTLKSGTLAASSYDAEVIYCIGKMKIESTFTRLELKQTAYHEALIQFSKKVINVTGGFEMADNLSIIIPTGGVFENYTIMYESDDLKLYADHVVIATQEGAAMPNALLDVAFPLWLGDTQVTYNNMDDIFGDGKAWFDPMTSTLTLNDPTIEGSHGTGALNKGRIYAKEMDLNVKGSYIMDETDWETYPDCGIVLDAYWGGTLTLDGKFQFLGKYGGIVASDNDVIMKSGSTTAIAYYVGYYTNNPTQSYEGGDGIICKNLVTKEDMLMVHLKGGDNAIYVDDLIISDNNGLIIPDEGVFRNKTLYNLNGERAQEAIISAVANVKFSKEGYATYYNSQKTIILHSDMLARIMFLYNNDTLSDGIIGDGRYKIGDPNAQSQSIIVPQGYAVVLQIPQTETSTVRKLSLVTTTQDFTLPVENLLYGSDEETMTTGNYNDAVYFKLSYGPKSNSTYSDVFAWWLGAPDGAAFLSGAHKAWLVVPREIYQSLLTYAARSFIALPGYEEAGTLTIDNEKIKIDSEDGAWYDMGGRKLSGKPTEKGIYIHNGRKEVVR